MEYIPAKSIVYRTNKSAWFGTEYNMNIYKGCNHGCIYCDSRSNCYQIDDFDQVKVKENALQTIRDDLRRKVKKGVIGTGSMSDPYNPLESELKLTRHALELVNAFGFGIAIATKSPLVTRDIDILKDIKEHSPVIVKMTVTCADDQLCKIIEPNVAPSSHRFQAINNLSQNGIYCGLLLMPLLPFLNDNEQNVLSIVRLAKESGAKFIYPGFGVTLRDRQRDYLYEMFEKEFKGYKEKYIKHFGNRYNCFTSKAKSLYSSFANECEKLGITYNMKEITRYYRRGYENIQLSLF